VQTLDRKTSSKHGGGEQKIRALSIPNSSNSFKQEHIITFEDDEDKPLWLQTLRVACGRCCRHPFPTWGEDPIFALTQSKES